MKPCYLPLIKLPFDAEIAETFLKMVSTVQPENRRKRGRPTELKPLCKFSPSAIREKTEKGFELLVKEWSDVNSKNPIPFDKYVAKLAMRYYAYN